MEKNIKIKNFTISYFNWYYRVFYNYDGKEIYEGHFNTLQQALEYVSIFV